MTGKIVSYRLFQSVTPFGQQRFPTVFELHCKANVYHVLVSNVNTRPSSTANKSLSNERHVHNPIVHQCNSRFTGRILHPTGITLTFRSMSSEVEKAGSKPSKQVVNDSDTSLVSTWLASYENFIGVKDVKEAQERVSMTEKEFLETRQQVKDSRQELEDIQSDLHLIRTRLDRTPRDDPKFLEYATEEHKTIQTEKQVNERHHRLLDKERETFDRLSAAVRESHVKQKAQEEKTKYWSIIGSVVGTVLGIIGSTFISQRRTKDLKGMVNDLKEQISFLDGGAGDELKTILQDLKKMTPADNSGTGLGDVSQKIINQTGSQLKSQEEVFSQLLEKHEKSFHDELKGVHRAISMGGSGDMSTFEELIGNAEQKLEWEVKMSTLATVVMVYGAFALTVPVLYNIFK